MTPAEYQGLTDAVALLARFVDDESKPKSPSDLVVLSDGRVIPRDLLERVADAALDFVHRKNLCTLEPSDRIKFDGCGVGTCHFCTLLDAAEAYNAH